MKFHTHIIVLIASLLLCSACHKNSERYTQVTQLLDISVPLELDNITKSAEIITSEKHFTGEQVAELQNLFIRYIGACADVQMSLMEENFGAAFNLDEEARQAQIEQLNVQMHEFRQYGIVMYDSGNGIFASVMPTYVAQVFADYISPSERDFSQLSELEIVEPSQANGFILVTYDEIATRLKLCDAMIARYPNDALAPQIEACRTYYLSLLTIGTDWNPVKDYETGELNANIRRVIEIYIDENPDGKSASELHELLETL